MPCYTMVEVLEDNAINRKARKALGLPLEGRLGAVDTRRVKIEAGVIKARDSIKKLDPRAIIKRQGNKLKVTIQR